MITTLNIRNFKSWEQTGPIVLGKLTGFWGANSSGKTSLLQFLLMMKQTTETSDRSRVLHTGNNRTLVNLGNFYDITSEHKGIRGMDFSIEWDTVEPITIHESDTKRIFNKTTFSASIEGDENDVYVKRFNYQLDDMCFGMERGEDGGYNLIHENFRVIPQQSRHWSLPVPVKSYGFPSQVFAYHQNVGFLWNLAFLFEQLMSNTYYLGPLRGYPSRSYLWAGEMPTGVGSRGEFIVSALLASRQEGKTIRPEKESHKRSKTLEEYVAEWLKKLGLVYDFTLSSIAPNRNEYEVRIRMHPNSPEVLITEAGFGIWQVFPVIALCFYAPEGSTIILEQPEAHLHPSIQAGLADVFIDAIKTRGVQIILESHSEYLLARLQRRIAEELIDSGDVKLFFAENVGGSSTLSALDVDSFGGIANWPENLFGDSMGDITARADAAINRKLKSGNKETLANVGAR